VWTECLSLWSIWRPLAFITLTWQLDGATNIVTKRRSPPLTGTTVSTAGLSPLHDPSRGQLNPFHRVSPRVFKINPTRSQCASPLPDSLLYTTLHLASWIHSTESAHVSLKLTRPEVSALLHYCLSPQCHLLAAVLWVLVVLFSCGRRPVWAALDRLLTTVVRVYRLLNVWASAMVPNLWFVEWLQVVRLCVCSPMHRAAMQRDKATDASAARARLSDCESCISSTRQATAINMAAYDM